MISAYESKYLAAYKEYLIESQKQANNYLKNGLDRIAATITIKLV
ncbi:uncharacterized protein METZ01_LOCUS74888 [marine metagenome]|uniref:Uncharacterized protein n=1 Tax=marine metagenome TaxID=408172 RepID=A0A381U1S6_9ZZZZ